MRLPSESECACRTPDPVPWHGLPQVSCPLSLPSSHCPGLIPDLPPAMPAAPHSPCYRCPCSSLHLAHLSLRALLHRPPLAPTGLLLQRPLVSRATLGFHVHRESDSSTFTLLPSHLSSFGQILTRWAESPLLVPSLHLSC